MSASGVGPPRKHKLCPACRHIYPGTSNFCPQDQTPLQASDDIIAGRYILERMVGAGAMGKVYMAEDTQLGRRVALKLLKPGQDVQRRIDVEAKAVGALDHDNVVRVYERGQHDDGRQYIAMEYLEGESLRQHLGTNDRLPLAQALELWEQAVRGVAAAHRKNVIHRDLKPDNLFLARREQDDGTIEQLKVLDFGIAQIRSDRPARGTIRIGTPGYVAPEQWMYGEATARSDVYSLGVILLEMLTGLRGLAANPQAPLEAVERLALAQTVSPELRQLMTEILSLAPTDRPQDARAVLERLRSLPERQPLGAGAVARETPASLSLSTSGEHAPRPPRPGEALPPLDLDDEEADTEQVGIESLRPPGRAAGPPVKGPGPATMRVEHLPGLVPAPTPERPTALRPEKARGKAPPGPRDRAPEPESAAAPGVAAAAEPGPRPVPGTSLPAEPLSEQESAPVTVPVRKLAADQVTGQGADQVAGQVAGQVADQVTGQVADQVTDQVTGQAASQTSGQVADPLADLVTGQVTGQVTDPLPESRIVQQVVSDSTSRLPLPAQSTLVIGSPAEMRTLNLPALGSPEAHERLASMPAAAKRSPAAAPTGGLAATVVSGRVHAPTLKPAEAQTLPIGSSASFRPPPELRSGGLREFLSAPTTLGSRGRVLMACAVLGLLVAAAVIGLLGS